MTSVRPRGFPSVHSEESPPLSVDALQRPDVSVVVVTWNRAAALRRCLESLLNQSYPADRLEVVLVDVSDTPVHEVVAGYDGRLRLRHVVARNLGVASNRNRGAHEARGRWLAFIDDDCVADPEWLTALVASARDDEHVLVGGRITIAADAGLWATVGQFVMEVVHAGCNPASGPVTFLPGCCILVSRRRFLALEGLDARFGRLGAEDRDLCDRWREAAGVMVYCASAVVRHDHRTTMNGFVRQQFNFGRGAWRYEVLRRQRVRAFPPPQPAPFRRLRELVGEPLRQLPFWRAWQVRLAVPVWLLAYASGFVWQRLTDR